VKASVRKRIRALEIVVAARIAEAEEREREDELFAQKLATMTTADRAEMQSIYASFENTAKQLGLCEPLGREGELTVLRNTPAEIRHRYREILDKYPD
jgi:hypothetical protein